MSQIFLEWLRSANDDLLLIEKNINDINLTHLMAFHAQQSIEKSLKSVLEYYNLDIPKVHSLSKLFDLCSDNFKFYFDYEIIAKLDKLYIDARYPGDLGLLPNGKPSINEAKKFYDFAKSVHESVRGKLTGKIEN